MSLLIGVLLSSDLYVIAFVFKISKASICFSLWSSVVSVCFSKAFPKVEYVNLACSIICCWLNGNISSPVRHSCLQKLADDLDDILAAYLLISYYSFSSLIWSLIAMILYYTIKLHSVELHSKEFVFKGIKILC